MVASVPEVEQLDRPACVLTGSRAVASRHGAQITREGWRGRRGLPQGAGVGGPGLGVSERVVQVDTASCAHLRDLASLQADFALALRFLETYLKTEDSNRGVDSSDEAL